MKINKEVAQTITAIGAVVVMAFAAVAYFATDEELKAVEELVVMNSKEDNRYRAAQRYKELQSVKWQMDKEFGFNCQKCPPSVLRDYQNILHDASQQHPTGFKKR